MSKSGSIRRYSLIIEKIKQTQYPSFQVIKDYLLSQGFEVSPRTVQRDIEQIRFEFGVEITYNRSKRGYYIDLDSSINFESFIRFLEIVNTAELLTESLQESKDSLKHISFESQGSLKGIENLKPLLYAIMNHKRIRFSHENFETGKIRKYSLDPYLLKEYQSRWYIVGFISDTSLLTFGIDRMTDLEVLQDIFTYNTSINPMKLFENAIGLTFSGGNAEEIILSFTPLQGKYLKSLPLHKSQVILKDDDLELIIRLYIIPNFEFIQKLLMLGETVTVIKPEWLINHLKKSLQNTLKRYK